MSPRLLTIIPNFSVLERKSARRDKARACYALMSWKKIYEKLLKKKLNVKILSNHKSMPLFIASNLLKVQV
jgi:hypothetical protein